MEGRREEVARRGGHPKALDPRRRWAASLEGGPFNAHDAGHSGKGMWQSRRLRGKKKSVCQGDATLPCAAAGAPLPRGAKKLDSAACLDLGGEAAGGGAGAGNREVAGVSTSSVGAQPRSLACWRVRCWAL